MQAIGELPHGATWMLRTRQTLRGKLRCKSQENQRGRPELGTRNLRMWSCSETGEKEGRAGSTGTLENICITDVGCSRHIALSTGLMRRFWGDCYRNPGATCPYSFRAEKGVGWRGRVETAKLCQQWARCSRSGEGCGWFAERALRGPFRLVDDTEWPSGSLVYLKQNVGGASRGHCEHPLRSVYKNPGTSTSRGHKKC